MPINWTSDPITLADGLVIQVVVTHEGISVSKQVDGVFASDTLYDADQAEKLGKALIEASAHSRA